MNDHGSRVIIALFALLAVWCIVAPLVAHLMGWL